MMPLVVPLPGNAALSERIAAAGGFDPGILETRRFPDGESYVRHRSDLSGRSVALVCTLNDADPKIMALLLAAGAAREAGASRVGLVAPYLAYMRQDRRFNDGEAVSATHFARLLSGAFDWLVTVDPHLHRIHRLDEVFSIPAETLHAGPLIADWVRAHIPDPLLIGPDAESEQWVSEVARIAGAPHAVARKLRRGDREVEIDMPDIGAWSGRRPVLIDDVASSGQTLIGCAGILRDRGMRRPACVVVHGIFAGDAHARLAVLCDPVATANTIEHPSNRVDVSGIVSDAIRRLAAA